MPMTVILYDVVTLPRLIFWYYFRGVPWELQIWSRKLKKPLVEKFMFCALGIFAVSKIIFNEYSDSGLALLDEKAFIEYPLYNGLFGHENSFLFT